MPVDISKVGSDIKITGLVPGFDVYESPSRIGRRVGSDGSLVLRLPEGGNKTLALADYTVSGAPVANKAAADAALALVFPAADIAGQAKSAVYDEYGPFSSDLNLLQAMGSKIKAMAYNTRIPLGGTSLASGAARVIPVPIAKSFTCARVGFILQLAQTGGTPAQNLIAIATNSAGANTIIAQTASSATFYTGTINTVLIIKDLVTPTVMPKGYVNVIMEFNQAGGTAPQVGAIATMSNTGFLVLDLPNSRKLSSTLSGYTAVGSFNDSAATLTNSQPWVCLLEAA